MVRAPVSLKLLLHCLLRERGGPEPVWRPQIPMGADHSHTDHVGSQLCKSVTPACIQQTLRRGPRHYQLRIDAVLRVQFMQRDAI